MVVTNLGLLETLITVFRERGEVCPALFKEPIMVGERSLTPSSLRRYLDAAIALGKELGIEIVSRRYRRVESKRIVCFTLNEEGATKALEILRQRLGEKEQQQKARRAEKRREREEARKRIKELRKEVEKLRRERDELAARVRELEKQVAELSKRLRSAERSRRAESSRTIRRRVEKVFRELASTALSRDALFKCIESTASLGKPPDAFCALALAVMQTALEGFGDEPTPFDRLIDYGCRLVELDEESLIEALRDAASQG